MLRGALGRRVAGVAVLSAAVCSDVPEARLSGAQVLQQAHKHNIIIFDGRALDALLTRTQGRSRGAIAADVGEALSLGGAVVTGSDLIKADKRWIAGLAIAAGTFRWLSGKFNNQQLNPAVVREFHLPDEIVLAGGGHCWRGDLLGVYEPGRKTVVFRFD